MAFIRVEGSEAMSTTAITVSIQLVEQVHYAQWLPHWLNYQAFYNVALSEKTTVKTWARFLMKKSLFIVLLQWTVKKYWVLFIIFSSFNMG